MLLLALDTSTPAVTVAVHDGTRVVGEATTVDARRHTELLMPLVVHALDRAGRDRRDITDIVVGVGPGPFTGLRVGLAAARVLGAALEVPVRGVCSLDVVAYEVRATGLADGPFLVATDARRGEVYAAAYAADGTRTAGPMVGRPAEIVGQLAGDEARPAYGAGALRYADAFPMAGPPEHPSASWLASAVTAGAVATGPPEPLYLRRPDVTMPAGRKSVLT